jgi:tripartite-type tricarboxylate transporter receptor subunit TctC
VPYRGSGPALADMLGGRVDIMFDNIPAAYPQVQAGKVKAFGINTARRSPNAPELTPIADALPGFDVSSWFAFFAPARTSREILEKLEADTRAAVGDANVKNRMAALGAEPVGSSADELQAFLQAEMDKWGRLITEAKIRIEG